MNKGYKRRSSLLIYYTQVFSHRWCCYFNEVFLKIVFASARAFISSKPLARVFIRKSIFSTLWTATFSILFLGQFSSFSFGQQSFCFLSSRTVHLSHSEQKEKTSRADRAARQSTGSYTIISVWPYSCTTARYSQSRNFRSDMDSLIFADRREEISVFLKSPNLGNFCNSGNCG